MVHLIDKSALVAEIESLKSAAETMLTVKEEQLKVQKGE